MGGTVRRAAALGAVGVAAVLVAASAAVSAQGVGPLSLDVTPATSLTSGQVITVDGTGFVTGGEHAVMQCQRGSVVGAVVDRAVCDESTSVLVTALDGDFTTPFIVTASITTDAGPIDCTAPGACEIVGVFATNTGPPAASAPIEFAPTPTTSTTAPPVAAVVAQPAFTG